MYVMHKRARVAIQPDGTTRETHPAETRTFGSGMEMLRFCLNERIFEHHIGGLRYPVLADEKWLGHPGDRTYGLVDTFTRWEVTPGHIDAMRRAQQRYREIVHYWREVEPGWQPDTSVSPTGEIHWADNSVERVDVDKRGNKRVVKLLAPGGDVCF